MNIYKIFVLYIQKYWCLCNYTMRKAAFQAVIFVSKYTQKTISFLALSFSIFLMFVLFEQNVIPDVAVLNHMIPKIQKIYAFCTIFRTSIFNEVHGGYVIKL